MDLGDIESSLKILLVGVEGVGKSSFLNVFCRGEYNLQHKKTIGTEFKEKNVTIPDTFDEIDLMLWEIGGSHTYSPMSTRYYKGANAVILMFSTNDRESFDKIHELKKKITDECGSRTQVVLVQNKIDLLDEATMTNDEVEQLARDLRIKLYRTCCQDRIIVEQVFMDLASKLTGSVAELSDIGDVIKTVGSPTPSESNASTHGSTRSLGVERPEKNNNIDINNTSETELVDSSNKQVIHLHEEKDAQEGNRQRVIFPRNDSTKGPPTVPSKVRTRGKQGPCKVM